MCSPTRTRHSYPTVYTSVSRGGRRAPRHSGAHPQCVRARLPPRALTSGLSVSCSVSPVTAIADSRATRTPHDALVFASGSVVRRSVRLSMLAREGLIQVSILQVSLTDTHTDTIYSIHSRRSRVVDRNTAIIPSKIPSPPTHHPDGSVFEAAARRGLRLGSHDLASLQFAARACSMPASAFHCHARRAAAAL